MSGKSSKLADSLLLMEGPHISVDGKWNDWGDMYLIPMQLQYARQQVVFSPLRDTKSMLQFFYLEFSFHP